MQPRTNTVGSLTYFSTYFCEMLPSHAPDVSDHRALLGT